MMLWKSYKDELDAICVDRATEQRFYHAMNKAAAQRHVSVHMQAVVGLTVAACVAVSAVGIGLHWFNGGNPPIYRIGDSETTNNSAVRMESTKTDNTTSQYTAGKTINTPADSSPTESSKGQQTSTNSSNSSNAYKVVPGKFKAMTEDEIAAYLGREPLPDDLPIPNGLKLQDIPRGIYEGKGAEQIQRTQFITYLYTDSTEDSRQSLEITVAKGHLPKLDEWELGAPTTIKDTTVYWYIYDDRTQIGFNGTIFYNAYALVDGIGYNIMTQNLPEEDFWTVVKSIVK